jgi:ABC-type branched-subunit amino acid transport system ATPase component
MRFLGQPIDRLSPEAIVKLGVAHVPERRRVFPGLTVRENILLGGSNRARASRRELDTDAEIMFVVFPELKPFAKLTLRLPREIQSRGLFEARIQSALHVLSRPQSSVRLSSDFQPFLR